MRMVHASRLVWPAALLLVLAGMGMTAPAHADDPGPGDCSRGATIGNGTVQLGVNCVGDLGTSDDHGLGFVPDGAEAVSQGCACEGWGVADGTGGVSGWANQSSGDSGNLSVHSFSADDTSAVSVVDVGSTFQVTQDFHPSPATPNLYEVAVTVANVSDAAVDLRYRRVMDWDIEPTPFNEMVTLEQGSSARILYTSDNGFASSDPQSARGKIDAEGSFTDSGPEDHGALFDFDFGQIDAGSSRSFKIFYGAADSEVHADAALNSVNAEAFSYGQPSTAGGADLGEPNTFIFGFKDIDGGSFFAPNATQDVVKAFTDEPRDVDVLKNDSDPNGDPLTITGSSAAEHGSASCTPTQCRYLSDPGYEGPDQFTYQVSDGNGGVAGATVSLTVAKRPANRPPDAVDDDLVTAEDGTASVEVLSNDSDPDEGDVLSVVGHTDGAHGTVGCTDSVCSYRPDADYNGADSFTYTVSDTHVTSTATVRVRVDAVNDAPVARDDAGADGTGIATDEDTSVPVLLTGNDTDVDGDALTAVLSRAPAHGSVSCTGGTCTYTPATDYDGADSFTYRAFDGTAYSSPATVSLLVRPVNDAPLAVSDGASTESGQPVEIDVLANDGDVDGDALSIADPTSPAHGVVACDLTCAYTPDDGFVGTDSFDYVADDAHGGRTTGTVTISVSAPNHAPVATLDDVTTPEDTGVAFSVVGNDSDPDGDALTATVATTPTHGTLACSAGACNYVPAANFNGTDAFTYTLTDAHGASSTGQVTIHVTPVNDPPVATTDQLTTDRDVARSAHVLANDRDADGDTLSAAVKSQPANGSVTCTAAGSCTFTPAKHWAGTTSFSYTVADAHGGLAVGTVAVTVNATTGVADAPTIATPKAGRFTISRKKYTAMAAWKAPSWTGGTALTGYKVSAIRYSGSKVVSTKTFTASKTSKTLYLALAKGTYAFKVVAVNAKGASTTSAASRKITVR